MEVFSALVLLDVGHLKESLTAADEAMIGRLTAHFGIEWSLAKDNLVEFIILLLNLAVAQDASVTLGVVISYKLGNAILKFYPVGSFDLSSIASALFLLLLTACGKAPQQTEEPEALQPTVQPEAPAGTDAPVRTEEAVTPEEQLARTGVPLTLPPEAEEPAWYVLSFAEGGRIAEARFTAEGVPYILRGEKARQDAPYNFSDLTEPQDGWSWTGFGTVGDVENCSAGSPAGTWYAWLDGDRAFACRALRPGTGLCRDR